MTVPTLRGEQVTLRPMTLADLPDMMRWGSQPDFRWMQWGMQPGAWEEPDARKWIEFMTRDGRLCTMNTPENVQALEYMVQLYDDLGGVTKVNAFVSGFQSNDLDPFLTDKVEKIIDNLKGHTQVPPVAAQAFDDSGKDAAINSADATAACG